MASSKGHSNRFTSSLGSYYPLTHFEQLSNRVSSQKGKHQISPREEIYLSLIKDIRSKNAPKLGRLVKKASGILRLSHLKAEVATTDQKQVSTSEPENHIDVSAKMNVKASPSQLLSKQVGSTGLQRSEVISKLVANGGDFSEIWDYIEATTLSSDPMASRDRPPSRRSNVSRTSTVSSRDTNASQRQVRNKKPPWRYFGNQKGLSPSPTSNTSIVPSVRSIASTVDTVASSASINSRSRYSTTGTCETIAEKKPDYMKHVFVINGQVVTFKGSGFENFTNWFGDVAQLSNIADSRTSNFKREFNLTGFNNQEIKMKLYEGYKLVIEAYRSNRDKQPPMRFKETVILPKGVVVEELTMCRYESGRLIMQDVGRKMT